MVYSDDALALQRPDLTALPRIGDQIAFLFLDQVRVEQGRTGLEAWGSDAATGQPLQIGKLVRARLHDQHVLPNMLTLTQQLLAGVVDDLAPDSGLLLDDHGYVPGLMNWALARARSSSWLSKPCPSIFAVTSNGSCKRSEPACTSAP